MWINRFYKKLQNSRDSNWIANFIFIKAFAFEEEVKCEGLPRNWTIFSADWVTFDEGNKINFENFKMKILQNIFHSEFEISQFWVDKIWSTFLS